LYRAVFNLDDTCANSKYEEGWEIKQRVLRLRLCPKDASTCPYDFTVTCELGYSGKKERVVEVMRYEQLIVTNYSNCNLLCARAKAQRQLSTKDRMINRLLNGRMLYGAAALPAPILYKSRMIHKCPAGHGLFRERICRELHGSNKQR
jgi:hypothetical protein